MGYTVSVTSAGQMTLPKALREKHGILSKVFIDEDEKTGKIVVEREKTREEQVDEMFSKLDAIWTDEDRAKTKKYAGMSFEETVDELEKTPEGRAAIEAEFGKGIYA
ncbi:AbrB/MazE/SpoVT family DNA-binding domain-containing protein [Candidatus Saccharibacteria bacterium]|nr:AbrB/MazE/SpoVT family DNA-binding domain-containing protein [Candidatus Saccharibacteria bacterium]